MSQVKREFPEFDDVLPSLPGFGDASWHNDACPSLRDESRGITVWVDFKDEEKRESGSPFQFGVYHDENSYPLLETNDWQAVVELVSRNGVEPC